MKKVFILLAAALFFCAGLSSCGESNKINFKNYPADYKIAYFENMEVNNIPSVINLFGPNASYADEFMEHPARVIVETYTCSDNEFFVVMLLKLEETQFDLMRCNILIEADHAVKKSYVRYVKVESLLSEQFLESKSDGTIEQDIQTFMFFLGYMELLWK